MCGSHQYVDYWGGFPTDPLSPANETDLSIQKLSYLVAYFAVNGADSGFCGIGHRWLG